MKSTRTYVINLNNIISLVCVGVMIIGIIFAFVSEGMYNYVISSARKYVGNTDNIISYFPMLSKNSQTDKRDLLTEILSIIMNENLENPSKFISGKISFISSVKDKLSTTYSFVNESNYYYMPPVIEKIINDTESIKYNPAIETTVKSVNPNGNDLQKKGIVINNKSGYNLNLNALYNEPLKIKKNNDSPQILIVHTHGSESYNPTDRNEDLNKNVVRVGREMAKVFEKNNIKVIHSEKMHDIPRFNNSYNNTLLTINDILAKNPTINIVLDIHRDAMIKETGEAYKVVGNVDGKKASQVMFVVGTNKSGLQHDNWRENLKFAIKCQEEVNKLSKNLARPIDLREERFNQHATFGSLIIEVGTNGNTLEESIISGKITAEAISKVINSIK